MKTPEDAAALCEKEHDDFYLCAFAFQSWLGTLIVQAAAEYAEKKNPCDRGLQTGQAWRGLVETFSLPGSTGVSPASDERPAGQTGSPSPAVTEPERGGADCPQPAAPGDKGPGFSPRLAGTNSHRQAHGEGESFKVQSSRFKVQLFAALLRFAEFDDPICAIVRRAFIPLSIEHECSGDFIGPNLGAPASSPAGSKHSGIAGEDASAPSPSLSPGERARVRASLDLLPQTLVRLCDWLDAVIHFQTHAHWHLVPPAFDPDADKRELAVLGANQRHFASLTDRAKEHWHWHHSDAAVRFKTSPKWPVLGQAMASDSNRLWTYRELDTAIISLWPLVRRHNWTYRDLLEMVRPALIRPDAYPCDREQDFATYCNNVLGLRKSGHGTTAKDGKPVGWEVARRICPALTTGRG